MNDTLKIYNNYEFVFIAFKRRYFFSNIGLTTFFCFFIKMYKFASVFLAYLAKEHESSSPFVTF